MIFQDRDKLEFSRRQLNVALAGRRLDKGRKERRRPPALVYIGKDGSVEINKATWEEVEALASALGVTDFGDARPRTAAGLRLIQPHQRDRGTTQTPGMAREEGVGVLTVGARSLWSGHVTVAAGVKSAPHHHGALESVIYVVRGKARMRWGERLQFVAEAGPGDFIYVPPFLPHQEINASEVEAVAMIVSRSPENVTVNLDIPEGKE